MLQLYSTEQVYWIKLAFFLYLSDLLRYICVCIARKSRKSTLTLQPHKSFSIKLGQTIKSICLNLTKIYLFSNCLYLRSIFLFLFNAMFALILRSWMVVYNWLLVSNAWTIEKKCSIFMSSSLVTLKFVNKVIKRARLLIELWLHR